MKGPAPGDDVVVTTDAHRMVLRCLSHLDFRPPTLVIGALRRVAGLPVIRAFLRSRHVEPVVATILRASPVRGISLFLARELRPPAEPMGYRLRGSGALVFVRHRTPDVAALGEVFYEHQYEPPAPVREALERLGEPLRILDLGANVGFFGVFAMARFPVATLTAVEPDPVNMPLLRRTMEANGWRWEVVEAAATSDDGRVEFVPGGFTTSRIEGGGSSVAAIDALRLLGTVDFAKVDIEGGEWSILDDDRLAEVAPGALVLEYHPYLCPVPDPAGHAEVCLREAGLQVVRTIAFTEDQGLLWAWR